MKSITKTLTPEINQTTLDFWAMKNMSTCEYESSIGISAWSEWDRITDASDDSDDSSTQTTDDDNEDE